MSSKKIGPELVRTGLVTPADVEAAAVEAARSHHRIGEILINRGVLEERDFYRALAEAHDLEFRLSEQLLKEIDPTVASRIPKRFQEFNSVIPIRVQDGHLLVATSNVDADVSAIGAAVKVKQVERVVVTPTDLRRLHTALSLDQAGQAAREAEAEAKPKEQATDLMSDSAATEEAQRVLDGMLLDAITERASDVHVEVYRGRTRVRIRVDGDLRDLSYYQLTEMQRLALVNVIKVRSGLDIAEHRLPQSGRFVTRSGNLGFDIRTQTQPCLHGEHVVMRLLPQDSKIVGIADLGFPQRIADTYRRLVDSPGGLILVVGPTGSGKSTTLYAALQVLAADQSRKVITIEDPIEYAIDGIQQTQVRADIGLDFASAMRAFVREDPDVILIGEIRDAETALEALRASQTGHLVISTLHCNEAVDAVQRLKDLGMMSNSIGSELLAIFSQRLVRRICENCKAPHTPAEALVKEVFPEGVPEGMTFYKGKGCDHCRGSGAHGRIAAVEFLPASAELRMAISRRVSVDELRLHGLRAGLLTLREHALQLVREGIVALEELPTLLPPDRLGPERTPFATLAPDRRKTPRLAKPEGPGAEPGSADREPDSADREPDSADREPTSADPRR